MGRAGAVRDNARWQLTDFQRFLAGLMITTASFLGAMAWGMGSLVTLFAAAGIVIIAGLGVFVLGLYYNSRPSGSGTATVVEAPPPPVGQIVARADLRVRLHLKGARGGVVKLRDPAVPTSKWPHPGDLLPVEVDRHTRHLRVRWDKADQSQPRAPEHPAAVEEEIEYAPTPSAAAIPAARPTITMNAVQSKIYLDDDIALGPGPEIIDDHDPTYFDANLSDLDLSDVDLSDLDLDLSDVDLSDLDSTDLELAEPASRATEPDNDSFWRSTKTIQPASPAQEEPTTRPVAPPTPAPRAMPTEPDLGDAKERAAGYELPMRPIPQPRPAELEMESAPTPTGNTQSMGVMLVVADVGRSLEFYRDLLGLTVGASDRGSAMLEFGSGRLLLRQVVDMSPVERRLAHLQIEVADVESSYRELKAKGVSFAHKPRVVFPGEKRELWAATLRDPDGHAVALTQWRDSEDAPH
jgi:catechol 2,3-dioxygenase-like lactoylglutathione lyase family enzyme